MDGASPDNDARLTVDNSDIVVKCNNSDDRLLGLVRVKSSHGHVTVHAKTNIQTVSLRSDVQQPSSPLVDLGGVNGSCDVTLEASSSGRGRTDNTMPCSSGDINDNIISTRVHFDSLAPESISTITSRGRSGNASITMDRKLEADVRLLSISNSAAALPLHLDAHSLTSDEMEDIRSTLMDVNTFVQNHQDGVNRTANSATLDTKGRSISIETDAYNGEWGLNALDTENNDQQTLSQGVEYTQGTMKNRSGEPYSRFDVRSRGKINIDGAASQALHGFQGKPKRESDPALNSLSSPAMPLLAVTTDGKIKLETLSWFGSIARRYGLEKEEEDTTRSVGRTASRSPRL